MNQTLRALPSVDQVLARDDVGECLAALGPSRRTGLVRQVLAQLRQDLRSRDGVGDDPAPERADLLDRAATAVLRAAEAWGRPSLRPTINATGVILHTGLGRAPLAPEALEAVSRAAARYCNLEVDLESGERGSRLDHVEERLCGLTGGEAAVVVNNNAGALLLMLSALARGREVIVSRGELVEIGGSFRMPDIIAASGARMREVGTTNRTHRRDFEAAIGPNTGLLLAVHPSNFRVRGFTAQVPPNVLVELGHRAGVPVIYDLGGGALIDLATWNLPHEPVVSQALDQGVAAVSFSGDKVLGGPQAGIVVGQSQAVDAMRHDPLMRALRCDKLILSALEATLRLYDGPPERVARSVPCLHMMTEPLERVDARAQRLAAQLSSVAVERLRPEVVDTAAEAGSGALPLVELPSRALALEPTGGTAASLARVLRLADPAVAGRLHRGRLLLDLRTVADGEVKVIAAALEMAVASEVKI